MVSGVKKGFIRSKMWLEMFTLAARRYPNPKHLTQVLWDLFQERAKLQGRAAIKYVKGNQRYFWDFNSPGWPSPAFDGFIERELERIYLQKPTPLQTLIVAITKKCPLRCDHCSEWDSLNKKEVLSPPDLSALVARFLQRGLSQLWLSGGEPLLRMEEVVSLSQQARQAADVWVLTSGYHLNEQRATRLASAGVTGVAISLDHCEPRAHDAFRNFEGAFQQATQGARAARDKDLLLCLSLCPTKAFVTRENLRRYGQLAKELGAGFIQIIEPRAVGHYKEQDVALSAEQQKLLEEFYLSMNYDPELHAMPMVAYHGYHQRRIGCLGAGERYLYTDTDGDLHACPFCDEKAGSALDGSLDETLEKMRARGCQGKSPATPGGYGV
jgi:MoaA/NifB/PqqE/SkfB family radical SAM enzyme